jgi:hypothetical protein
VWGPGARWGGAPGPGRGAGAAEYVTRGAEYVTLKHSSQSCVTFSSMVGGNVTPVRGIAFVGTFSAPQRPPGGPHAATSRHQPPESHPHPRPPFTPDPADPLTDSPRDPANPLTDSPRHVPPLTAGPPTARPPAKAGIAGAPANLILIRRS